MTMFMSDHRISHAPDLHRQSHGNFARDSFRQPKHIRDANRRQLLETYSEENDCVGGGLDTRPPSSQFTQRSSNSIITGAPQSQISSKTRLSMISLTNIESGIIDHVMQSMNANQSSSVESIDERLLELHAPPKEFLPRIKYYYDRWGLRHFVPIIIMSLYSIVGAALFYLVEHDNEQRMLVVEAQQLEVLRNDTFVRLRTVMGDARKNDDMKLDNSRDVLVWYEQQLTKIRIPEGLVWDIWGALFYVGTIFTTIGYGNIVPRTVSGRALSIVYAIIGIPLVLAILSRFGNTLTNGTSSLWLKYRRLLKWCSIRKTTVSDENATNQKEDMREKQSFVFTAPSNRKTSQIRKMSKKSSRSTKRSIEDGRVSLDYITDDDEDANWDEMESQTIPIWLALLMCIGWICGCAGLFCLWETRWSYFTSFYFFFISLSTIGLGDVVPDHPRMMIINFWLVIIGLSLVSMLLSVIQIKIEEWLYQMMLSIQREYRKALAMGESPEKTEILAKLMKRQPWYMRQMAPRLVTERQVQSIDDELEKYDKLVRPMNNKSLQTGDDDDDDDSRLSMASSSSSAVVCLDQTDSTSHARRGTTTIIQPPIFEVIDDNSPPPLPPDHISLQWSEASDPQQSTSLPVMITNNATNSDRPRSVYDNYMTASNRSLTLSLISLASLPIDPNGCNERHFANCSIQVDNDRVSLIDRSMQADAPSPSVILPDVTTKFDQSCETLPILRRNQSQTTSRVDLCHKSVETDHQNEQQQNLPKTMISRSVDYGYELFAKAFGGGVQQQPDSLPVDNKYAQTEMSTSTIESSTSMEQLIQIHSTTSISDLRDANGQTDNFENTVIVDPKEYRDQSVQAVFTDPIVTPTSPHKQPHQFFKRPKLFRQQKNDETVTTTLPLILTESSTQCKLTASNVADIATQTARELMLNYAQQSSSIDWNNSNSETNKIVEKPQEIRFSVTIKKDLIIQTDDSYLKIARRLDEFRHNRADSLHVCMAAPLKRKRESIKLKQDSIKEQRENISHSPSPNIANTGITVDTNLKPPSSLNNSSPRSVTRSTRQSIHPPPLPPLSVKTMPRSFDRLLKSPTAQIANRPGSPAGGVGGINNIRSQSPYYRSDNRPTRKIGVITVPGKVSDYIAKHEKGIHSPAKFTTTTRKRALDLIYA